jgi:hypothetical protein
MMPSPGQSAIATILGGKTYSVEGGFDTAFKKETPFIQTLASAMDSGWTSASPTTTTTMATTFASEFADYLAGQGLTFIDCIAVGIDQETAAWAASWDTQAQVHTYAVNAASIVSRIQGCSPLWSNGAKAISEAAADAFMSGFGQETG